MKVAKLALPLCLFAATALGQSEFKERSDISSIRGMSRVYVVANAEHFKEVQKDIAKALTLVNKQTDADFVLEYKHMSTSAPTNSLGITSETVELDAYLFRNGEKVLAWSDSTYDGFGLAAKKLTKKFLKALLPPSR